MSSSSTFPTHHISDDGTSYVPGEMVCVDHSSGHIQIVKDPVGDYEVMNCRPATEYGSHRPLLRLGLRKREAPSIRDPHPWTPQVLIGGLDTRSSWRP